MEKLVKDRECIRCEKIFDCKGKEKGKMCLWLKERKHEQTGKKTESKGS